MVGRIRAKMAKNMWRERLSVLNSPLAAAALVLSEVYGRPVADSLETVSSALEAWARLHVERGGYVRQVRTLAAVRAGMAEGKS
jgi:hypothetical protein